MAELSVDDERDDTHFWIFCPGCHRAGKIGVPHGYPADVVVCPGCRQVVNVRPEDRILWRPADHTEFLQRQFPQINWDTIDREPAPDPGPAADDAVDAASHQPAAGAPREVADEPVALDKSAASSRPATLAAPQSGRAKHFTAARFCATAAVVATLLTLITLIGQRPPRSGQRRSRQPVRAHDTRDEASRNVQASADPAAAPWQPPASAPAPQVPPRSPLSPPPAAPAPVSPPRLTCQELFDRASQQMQAGEYAGAVEDLNEVLRLDPGRTIALEQRMEALFQLGRYQQALADVNDEIRLLPTKYRPLVSRAVVYEALGDWRQAVDDLTLAMKVAAAEVGPGNDAGAARAAVAKIVKDIHAHAAELFRERQYSQAIDLFTVLMREQPGEAAPVFWRALCYQSIGADAQALVDFNRGLAMPSAPAWGFEQRSMLHERNQDLGAAVRDMREAVRLAPANQAYHKRLDRLKQLDTERKYRPQPYPPLRRNTTA